MAAVSAIGNLNAGVAPQNAVLQNGASTGTSGGGLDSLLGSLLGPVASTAASVYGSQNAAEAQNSGILSGIGTQNQTMGNINNLFSTQQTAGNTAFGQLGTNPFATQQAAGNNALTQLQTLQGGGASGAAPDYSGFSNSPGYQFALQTGERAIQTGAAANGAAYSPNTLANIGQFAAGTASQNYNNYVQQLLSTAGIGAQGNSGQSSQLLGTAGLGAQGNNALATANLSTGGNISQLQQNSGVVQGAGVNSAAGSIGGALGSLLGGTNGSGVISAIGNGINSLFGNNSSQPNTGNANGLNVGNVNTNYSSPIYDTSGQGTTTSGDTTYFGDSSNP